MAEKFIKNHEFNFIKKQVGVIKNSLKTGADKNVKNAVKDSADAKITELFADADAERRALLDLSHCSKDEDYDQYINTLGEYVQPFPQVSEQQIKKMFPKNKKLKMPRLEELDLSRTTYLSWNDIGSNKKFLLFELDGRLAGVECKYTLLSRDNVCSFCCRHGQVAFISAVTKAKKSNNPDYYKAIGNYICSDSSECNKKITNTDYLTSYIEDVLREK
ncbi:FusB/FusC family EF-G-binding protein [Peribacillus kribbensis]|uniref:FusB/FusC family EF-G-binding protein n=1 Tax=Peribacillus kribbensis TaxID=356658 RepID=UPI0004066B0F|nr:elongation factor G-binding protein [Peribacillus kribbensis]